MADVPPLCLHLADADATARLGQWFAARRAEDVPSPTFTLVQSYQADVEIWHADLYRLSHPDEVLELGLDEAFDSAICLIEWPNRLGSLLPKGAMRLRFALEGEGRRVAFLPGQRTDLVADLAKGWADHD
jgi:tRNA threonylcarbamoyladenosine biosynthesis protein TsaE